MRLRPFLSILLLGLAACRKGGEAGDQESSARSAAARRPEEAGAPFARNRAPKRAAPLQPWEMPGGEVAAMSPYDFSAEEAEARGYARSDPEQGIRWIATFDCDATGYLPAVRAFIAELLTRDCEAALRLTDLMEPGERRDSWSMLLFRELADVDAPFAWAAWKDGRGVADRGMVLKEILYSQTTLGPLEAAWKDYRAHDTEAGEVYFVDHIGFREDGVSVDEARFALSLLDSDPNHPDFGSAFDNLVMRFPKDDRLLRDWLAAHPDDPRYDSGYARVAFAEIDAGNLLSAATWAARLSLHSGPGQSMALVRLREHLPRTDSATRAKILRILPELQEK